MDTIEIYKLTDKYFKLKSELLDYTDIHHDAMHDDCMGFTNNAEQLTESDVEQLKRNIKGYQSILNGYKQIKHIFA